MHINNKITKLLTGPYIFFGLVFIPVVIFGLLDSQWIIAMIFGVIVWYLFATYTGVEIDTDTRMYRTYNKHFGLFKTGNWRSLEPFVGLTLVPIRNLYGMYSRSNRTNVSEKKEFRIYLVNRAKKPAVEIKTCATLESGLQSIDEFSIWLKLPVYSVKH